MIKRFEEFVNLISNIHKDIQKIKQDRMRKFGLSGNHVMCLFYLAQHQEGLTATQLCQLMSVNKAAVSRTMAELKDKDYIFYMNQEDNKKYRAVARLTVTGFAVTEQLDGIICEVVNEIGKDLEENERRLMYQSLETVSKNLDILARK
jgi:DNA-binding MarR family transcriptional regulator